MPIQSFAVLAADPDAPVDALALALAAEFRDVDADAALAHLDDLGEEVAAVRADLDGADAGIDALREVLGVRHSFHGDQARYDDPANSMLDIVLERRRGLPIVLSVLYVATARRAGIALSGVGLPGHYVVRDLTTVPPVLIDPFAGGTRLEVEPSANVRPWGAHETALRMLTNLVGSYRRRSDLGRAIRAAELRLTLPSDPARGRTLRMEWLSLQSQLN
ncbi:MAG TPA: transglutaminase-like domain-containing protein [Solirubrobacteraceae bacterium]|nr:transglutaminase-like domain-containing protein [Solirubrobacteraceae bacterium]